MQELPLSRSMLPRPAQDGTGICGLQEFLLCFFAVRISLALLILALAATVVAHTLQEPTQEPTQQPTQQPPQTAPPATPAPSPEPPAEPQAPVHSLAVVVLDPAHGGADQGARGTNAVEKDVVLALARIVRSELERLGFHAALTRDGDQNPSFDDRAAVANARHGAIFISLHVSSTGPGGTVRAYAYEFSTAPAAASLANSPAGAAAKPPEKMPAGWIEWDTAQRPFTDLSRRLADVLQVELSQKFQGSPEISSAAAVRELRTVAAPAVAVELSSVTADDAKTLLAMGPALATAIGRAVLAFRPLYESGMK